MFNITQQLEKGNMNIEKLNRLDIEKLDRVYFGGDRRPRRCIRVFIDLGKPNPIEVPGYFNGIKEIEFNLFKLSTGEIQWIGVEIGDVIEILKAGHKNRLCKIVQLEPDVRVTEISYHGVKLIKLEPDEQFIKGSRDLIIECNQKLKALS